MACSMLEILKDSIHNNDIEKDSIHKENIQQGWHAHDTAAHASIKSVYLLMWGTTTYSAYVRHW